MNGRRLPRLLLVAGIMSSAAWAQASDGANRRTFRMGDGTQSVAFDGFNIRVTNQTSDGEFDLSWYGSGGLRSTGGDFELSGTIGQPDAGEMSGGDFTLAGGFWGGVQSSGGCNRDPEWICDGDVDGDGQVNPVDSGLVQAAFGSTDEDDLCQQDIDCDGQINPVDSGIVQSLFGTCESPRDPCP